MTETTKDIKLYLKTTALSLNDMLLYLYTTDGVVLQDISLSLQATDGVVLSDIKTCLKTIRSNPTYTTFIAQRLSSVISEV